MAADATWARLAERDRADIGAHRSRIRRSLIALSAVTALVAAGLIAVFLGVAELNQREQPGVPYSLVDPPAAAPMSSANAAATWAAATGPALGTPSPGIGAPGAAATGANLPAAPGSTPETRTPAASTPPAGVSPTLLSLCRAVVAAGSGWPSALRGADRATVIAAAGSKKNVLPYCTALLSTTPAA